MNQDFLIKAHTVISEFMNSVNSMNRAVLHEKFGVTEPVLEEICECLGDYFGQQPDISIAPTDVALSDTRGSKPYIDIYEINTFHTWGVECVIFVGNKATEPILHVELFDDNGNLELRYRYIGS